MRFIRVIVLLGGCLLIGGCVLTTNKVRLNEPVGVPAKGAYYSKNHVALKIGKISDKRGLANPNFIVHKRDAFGLAMSGGIEAEQPVADVIQQYLRSGMAEIGYNIASTSSQYTLTGSLEKTGYHFKPGIMSITDTLWTKINLRLVNNKTGKSVWHEDIVSYGKAETSSLLIAPTMSKAFNNSLINLVHKVQTSGAFYKSMN